VPHRRIGLLHADSLSEGWQVLTLQTHSLLTCQIDYLVVQPGFRGPASRLQSTIALISRYRSRFAVWQAGVGSMQVEYACSDRPIPAQLRQAGAAGSNPIVQVMLLPCRAGCRPAAPSRGITIYFIPLEPLACLPLVVGTPIGSCEADVGLPQHGIG
jgi:hypothetical protein